MLCIYIALVWISYSHCVRFYVENGENSTTVNIAYFHKVNIKLTVSYNYTLSESGRKGM
jgi:hypothetical protein